MTKALPSIALLFAGLFLISTSTSLSAQEYILDGSLNGQTIETCGGIFYDSGGPNGTYDSGEDYTVTFCTADEEECLKVNLSSFNTESGWDFLNIFDGPDENSTLIGSFSGQNAPDVLYGSGACMTFNFTSDGSVTNSGWAAEFSCQCDTTTFEGVGAGCPNISLGADSLNLAGDFDVTCEDNCTTVYAGVLETGLTTEYAVSAIEYNPPFPFNAGTGFSVGTDDVWSSALTIPFNFCYFGNTYNQIVVGSNGLMSFNTGFAGGYCPYAFTAQCPSPDLPSNSIFGVYHDIDPSVCGDARYAILGEAPCRVFVFNFDNVCHYESFFTPCTNPSNPTSTTQVVLYETTNIIEIYVQDKPTCTEWNSGNAVIGIQNIGGTQGYVAPGRQTGPWSASEEAWRFTPDGTPNYEITWYDNDENIIGNGASIDVCIPPTGTSYVAEVLYTSCDGSLIAETDTIHIGIDLDVEIEVEQVSCGDNCDGSLQVFPGLGTEPYTYDIGFGPQPSNLFENLCPGDYTVAVVDVNGCTDYRYFEIEQPSIPNPGQDAEIFACESDGPFSMTGALEGNPDAGGQWFDGNLEPVSEIFDPAVNSSGLYTYMVGAEPCDTTATLLIEVTPTVFTQQEAAICEGDNYTLPSGEVVSQEGVYEVTLQSPVTGCDSIITTTLEVFPNFTTSITAGLCGGEALELADGTTVSEAGIYEVVLPTVNGCDSTIIIDVTVVTVNAGVYPPSCNGQFVANLNGSSSPFDPEATLTWSGSDELSFANENNPNTQVTADEGGVFTIELTDSRCPDAPATTQLSLLTPPQVEITSVDFVCAGEVTSASLVLEGNYAQASYVWIDSLGLYSMEDGSEIYINSEHFEDLLPYYNYSVQVIVPGISPCPAAVDTMSFDVIECEIVIPNIFTPNSDGTNDVFEITGISSYPNSRLIVLNRWGKVVYENNNYGTPYWNGKHFESGADLADGVYFYELIVGRIDESHRGTVTIVRD